MRMHSAADARCVYPASAGVLGVSTPPNKYVRPDC